IALAGVLATLIVTQVVAARRWRTEQSERSAAAEREAAERERAAERSAAERHDARQHDRSLDRERLLRGERLSSYRELIDAARAALEGWAVASAVGGSASARQIA